jgi:hypothetical protein
MRMDYAMSRVAKASTSSSVTARGHASWRPALPVGSTAKIRPCRPRCLGRKWVDGAELLYVGKAPRGLSGRRGLAARLAELIAFGYGRGVGHWGGRYLWQLAGSGNLEVAWLATAAPAALENEILMSFCAAPGAFPFASIAGPRE